MIGSSGTGLIDDTDKSWAILAEFNLHMFTQMTNVKHNNISLSKWNYNLLNI